jgi:hypothetical protein
MTFSDFFIGGLLLGTTLLIFMRRDWRWRIAALAGQYLGVFILILDSWPIELAAVKLVAGWMACVVLWFTRLSLVRFQDKLAPVPTGLAFRLLAAALVIVVVFATAPGLPAWAAPISLVQAWGALLLIGMGLLHVGLSSRTLSPFLGLLTVISGFEILYSAIEASTLVAGLLAIINLGIALVGAYLLLTPRMEPLE